MKCSKKERRYRICIISINFHIPEEAPVEARGIERHRGIRRRCRVGGCMRVSYGVSCCRCSSRRKSVPSKHRRRLLLPAVGPASSPSFASFSSSCSSSSDCLLRSHYRPPILSRIRSMSSTFRLRPGNREGENQILILDCALDNERETSVSISMTVRFR